MNIYPIQSICSIPSTSAFPDISLSVHNQKIVSFGYLLIPFTEQFLLYYTKDTIEIQQGST